jgi:hypothetical protein
MASQEASVNDFGLLIAYVLPGFAALWGMTYVSPEIRGWIGTAPVDVPTVGGFLYTTVASVAAGLTVSTVRWLIIDAVHHWTGLRRPQWDFARFQEHVIGYNVLTDIHYRYYQFYGNSCIALLWVALMRRFTLGWPRLPDAVESGLLLLLVIFFLGSRDTLRKYYLRTGQLLKARRTGR